MSEISVSNLKDICIEMKNIREKIKNLDSEKKELNAQLSKLKAQTVEHLDEHEINNFDFGDGKVSITEKRTVKMLDKFEFFKWLKERETFEDVVSVNAQTLNSIYRDEYERAQDEGNVDFLTEGLPGVSAPNVFRDIRFLK